MFTVLAPLFIFASLASSACIPAGGNTNTATPPKTTSTTPPQTPAPAPVSGSVRFHPNGDKNWCLEVQGNKRANGTPVQLAPCTANNGAQAWTVSRGSTQVKLAGTNFCLDAGSTPGNGVRSKIWTCYAGLAAQRWWYTDDNRVALEGKGQCIDLPSGEKRTGNVVQTWQCGTGNNNQAWTTSQATVARRALDEPPLTPGGRKAGLAGGEGYDEMKDLIGWWYDWSGKPSGHSGAPIAVPMLWGNGHRGSLQNDAARFAQFTSTWSASNAPPYVLGFNEPDCASGESASMSVGDSVWAWNKYIAPLAQGNSRLISPAMCAQLHESFLKPFSDQISTPFDIVAVHIYKPDIAQLKAVLDYFWNKYNKPMWVTEWGCVHDQNGFQPCWDQGQNAQFMRDAVRTFQADSRVYAYAPCNVHPNWVVSSGGKLTELGRVYRDAVRQYA